MNEHDDIFKPNDFTNDKKNQGSVNPQNQNNGFGVNTSPFPEVDKIQANLYEKFSIRKEKKSQNNNIDNKIGVNTNTTQTPDPLIYVSPSNSESQIHRISKLFSQKRANSKVVGVRLDEELFNFISKKATQAGIIPSAWIRYRIIADYIAENFEGIDVNSTLDFSLVPKMLLPLNLNVAIANTEINTNRVYEKELLEPRLKAKLRKVCEEILSGAPKIRKFNPQKFDYDYILPPLEDQKKWYKEKEAQMLNIIKTLGKLKVQLDPELESLFKKTSEKLWEVDA